MSLRIRRIERAKDFVALAPLWSEMAKESGQTSPFLSHDWFRCCWHGVWPRQCPEIILIEEACSPVAIIPLMHWKDRLYGLPVRCSGFLECPDSPMADMLVVGEYARVLGTFLDHLSSRSDWDTLRLEKIPVSSPTLKALEEMLPSRLPWRRAGNCLSPYLTIVGEWAAFYNSQSQSFKMTCQLMQDRFGGGGNYRIETHHAVDTSSALFKEVIELMRRKAGADGALAMTTMPRMEQFFSELTRRSTKNGWLSLWLLKLNSRVIAVEYQLRSEGKVHALRAGDCMADLEVSPVSGLSFAIIRSLFEDGDAYEYTMGPGLTGYKLQWATGTQETARLKLYRPGIYSQLLHMLDTAAFRRLENGANGLPSKGGSSSTPTAVNDAVIGEGDFAKSNSPAEIL
jgi:CelD/BcsL family acetyltransferase involved in cellulose biosynthesis